MDAFDSRYSRGTMAARRNRGAVPRCHGLKLLPALGHIIVLTTGVLSLGRRPFDSNTDAGSPERSPEEQVVNSIFNYATFAMMKFVFYA
jgi:hypothetical protein